MYLIGLTYLMIGFGFTKGCKQSSYINVIMYTLFWFPICLYWLGRALGETLSEEF